MWRLVRRRLGFGALTLFVVSVLVFLIVHNIPGDPIGIYLQKNANPEVRAELERYYGLDRSLPEQYVRWLGSLFQGDLGRSIFTGESVTGLLLEPFARTVYLMLGGLVLALLVSVPLALWAAARRARAADLGISTVAIGLQSLPEFWIGMVLVLVFAVELGWFAPSGYVDLFDSPTGFLQHAFLPMVAVGAILTGLLVRTLRSSMLEQLRQDYVTTALAQGVPYRRAVCVHALRNALIPTVTLIGVQIGILLGGTVIVEKVFAYPGMGSLLVRSLSDRDYPVVQGGLLLFATAFVLVNLLTDIAAIVLEPKNRRAVAG